MTPEIAAALMLAWSQGLSFLSGMLCALALAIAADTRL